MEESVRATFFISKDHSLAPLTGYFIADLVEYNKVFPEAEEVATTHLPELLEGSFVLNISFPLA